MRLVLLPIIKIYLRGKYQYNTNVVENTDTCNNDLVDVN